jgi:hypothetical protein
VSSTSVQIYQLKADISSVSIRKEERNKRIEVYEFILAIDKRRTKAMSSEQTKGKEKCVKFKEAKPSISLTNDEGEQLNGLDCSK